MWYDIQLTDRLTTWQSKVIVNDGALNVARNDALEGTVWEALDTCWPVATHVCLAVTHGMVVMAVHVGSPEAGVKISDKSLPVQVSGMKGKSGVAQMEIVPSKGSLTTAKGRSALPVDDVEPVAAMRYGRSLAACKISRVCSASPARYHKADLQPQLNGHRCNAFFDCIR